MNISLYYMYKLHIKYLGIVIISYLSLVGFLTDLIEGLVGEYSAIHRKIKFTHPIRKMQKLSALSLKFTGDKERKGRGELPEWQNESFQKYASL